ncbi:GNAT family N-acetyltransferase [Polaromonas sp.]|uniref:GNAT family N-acetyltransferase n=1 Tax=Polaromonas sp. TaxID=1869339 RepID=UPI003263C553
MFVRRATPLDLEAIVPLFDDYRQFNGKSSDPVQARTFLSDRLRLGESVIFVAESELTILGFVQLFPGFSSVSLARTFVVNDLFVSPSHRRKGIASSLLQAAAHHAGLEGAVRITASTAIDNVPTQILNEANGFVRDKSFYVYHLHPRTGEN